jgi:hypothetical protein
MNLAVEAATTFLHSKGNYCGYFRIFVTQI